MNLPATICFSASASSLLTAKQQALLLEMVKNILQVDNSEKRISVRQYNKELAEAEKQIVCFTWIHF